MKGQTMAKSAKTPPAPPAETGLTDYIVSEKAPSKVADRHVQPGDRISLTEDQARFDELAQHIVKAPAAAPSKPE